MIKIDTFDTMQIKKSFTTLKGQERIKQILRNAEIVFLTKGYSGFSMRGVATQSNISLSTLQHYFQNKDILLKALLNKLICDYIQRIEILINLNANEPPLIRFMNIITNIIYEIEQPIITNAFKEFSLFQIICPMYMKLCQSYKSIISNLSIKLSSPFIIKYLQKNIKKERLL